jgi:hypothetical protein
MPTPAPTRQSGDKHNEGTLFQFEARTPVTASLLSPIFVTTTQQRCAWQQMEVTVMSASPTDDKVGILLVNGMGNHQRGDFLRQLGEPLYHWITSWLGRGDPNIRRRPLQSRNSSFRIPHPGEADAPAHSVVETAFSDETGERRRVTWVTADGWWANEIVPPSFSQVASWGLGLAPWMIVRHFRPRWRGLLLVPSLVLVVLFQIVILALTTLGAIPKLRNYIVSLQLAITGSLGDVMVMASSPLQFSAMTTRLVSDLQWLQSQVPNGRIAVIAHSQGTGVSHAALQESRVPVDLFVTFGAALEKLHIARQVQQNRRRLALGSTLTTAGVVLLAIAAGTWIKGDPFSGNPGSAYIAARVLIAVGAVLLLARMGLWFHLGRLGGGLLTLFGVIALITSISLASGAKPLIDHPWYEAPLRIHQLGWSDMVPDKWHWASLAAFTLGLILVILRELVFLRKRDRIDVEDPGSRPSVRALRGIWGVRALLDPLSAFGNFAAAGAVIFGIFCIAMSTRLDRPPEDDAIVLLVTAGLAFCFAAVPIPVGGVTEPTPDDFRIPRRESRMTWHNYWATADLVPDGDLPVSAHRYVHNHEITNRGSVLADHTSYHENTEEFLADIVGNLSRLARWPLIRQDEVGIFKRASHRRRWRVRFLSIAGSMSFIGMVTTWWVLGRAGMEPLGQPLESLLGNVVGVVPGVNAERVEQWLPAWRLGHRPDHSLLVSHHVVPGMALLGPG